MVMLNVALLATKGIRRARAVGLRRLVIELPERLFRRRATTGFDERNGTDTETAVPLWDFRLPFASARFGAEYRSVAEARITDALSEVPRRATFVDLGSGKGRTLIVAARLGFTRVIGVEFVRELADISRRNLDITGITAEVLVADAGEWRPPEGPLCIYLYSPFSIEVMRRIVRNLDAPRDELWVTYLNPASSPGCAALFDASMKRVAERSGLVVWRRDGR